MYSLLTDISDCHVNVIMHDLKDNFRGGRCNLRIDKPRLGGMNKPRRKRGGREIVVQFSMVNAGQAPRYWLMVASGGSQVNQLDTPTGHPLDTHCGGQLSTLQFSAPKTLGEKIAWAQ